MEQSKTRNALSFGIGKISGKSSKKGSSIDDFVKKVFSNKTEKYASWNLFQIFSLNKDTKKLKVILTYTPDVSAKPMMKPMENREGKYVFSYRINSSMKIFDENSKLILEKEFAAISGTGKSKTWGSGPKKMILTSDKNQA